MYYLYTYSNLHVPCVLPEYFLLFEPLPLLWHHSRHPKEEAALEKGRRGRVLKHGE